MAITKEKLTILVQDQLGMTRQESKQIVDRVLKIMKHTLALGEHILISGFGKFSVRQKKARRGRNPQTSEDLMIRARKVVIFKPSGTLRRRLNSP